MYNKLFSKILDSSIWLESDTTRIVWFTLLAAMDEDGLAQFASVVNVSHRARVSVEAATEAIRVLEAPDPNSSDPDNEGRRIERTNGGWFVLNAPKYRQIVTREMARHNNRIRQQRFRDSRNASVTVSNGKQGKRNGRVTPSEAHSGSDQIRSEKDTVAPLPKIASSECESVYAEYPRKVSRPKALEAIRKSIKQFGFEFVLERTKLYAKTYDGDEQFIPYPATWFNGQRFNDDPSTWRSSGKHKGNQRLNPRNIGVAKGPTDYGEAAKRQMERQALEAENRRKSQAQTT